MRGSPWTDPPLAAWRRHAVTHFATFVAGDLFDFRAKFRIVERYPTLSSCQRCTNCTAPARCNTADKLSSAFSMSWSLHRFARWRNRHSPGCTDLHRSRIPGFGVSAFRNDCRAAPARSSHHSTVRARPQTISLADSGDASACQGVLNVLPSISSNRPSTSNPRWRSTCERPSPSSAMGARIVEPSTLYHGPCAEQQPRPGTGR